MKRENQKGNPIKLRALWLVLAAVCALIGYCAYTRQTRFSSKVAGNSINLTEEYQKGLLKAGYRFTPTKAYEVAKGRDFHGNVSSVTAYKFPISESSDLLESLKIKSPDFEWKEIPVAATVLPEFWKDLPTDFHSSSNMILFFGKNPNNTGGLRFFLNSAEGLLYCHSN